MRDWRRFINSCYYVFVLGFDLSDIGDMVNAVVDVEAGVIALDAELHSDL